MIQTFHLEKIAYQQRHCKIWQKLIEGERFYGKDRTRLKFESVVIFSSNREQRSTAKIYSPPVATSEMQKEWQRVFSTKSPFSQYCRPADATMCCVYVCVCMCVSTYIYKTDVTALIYLLSPLLLVKSQQTSCNPNEILLLYIATQLHSVELQKTIKRNSVSLIIPILLY